MRTIAWILAASIVASGCAQIKSSSTVEVVPRDGGKPVVVGSPHGQVTARGAVVDWQQHASRLEVQLHETRRCKKVTHEPVVRVEHEKRKAGGALYWEYGIGGALLVVGLIGLIRPELYGNDAINSNGDTVKDTRTGYRIGGIFTALGTVLIGVGVYDTIRARDRVHYADAYKIDLGEEIDCAAPKVPMKRRSVELIIGDYKTVGETGKDGVVKFELPASMDIAPEPEAAEPEAVEPEPEAAEPEAAGPEAAEPEPEADTGPEEAPPSNDASSEEPEPEDPDAEPPPPKVEIKKAVIRIDKKRATSIDFVVPYASEQAQTHKGTAELPWEGIGSAGVKKKAG